MVGDKTMETDTDTSLSFLEPVVPMQQPQGSGGRAAPKRIALPDVVDPAFLSFKVVIPAVIEEMFRDTEAVKFLYEYTDDPYLSLVDIDSKQTAYKVRVAEYGEFDFPDAGETRLLFIIGKARYRTRLRSAQKREYLASIANGGSYEAMDEYKLTKAKYLRYQIEQECNIVYLEDGRSLHKAIKDMAVLVQKEARYVPKVKTHAEDGRDSYFVGIVKSVPGISELAARHLYEKFGTFRELRAALQNAPHTVESLVVYDAEKQVGRKLGGKNCQRLADALFTDEQSKKV